MLQSATAPGGGVGAGLRRCLVGAAALLGAAAATPAAQADDIWALLAADTLDDGIGRMVQTDLDKMERLLVKVSERSGMKLNLTILVGHDFTQKEFALALNSMRPAPDDVVVAYISSHGLRDMNSSSPWPDLAVNRIKMPFSWVLGELDDGDPRLVVAIADSCNRDLKDGRRDVRSDTRPYADGLGESAYTQLFTDTAGYFVAAAASPGQLSTATSEGSLFTLEFISSIGYAMSTPNADWDEVRAMVERPLWTDFDENKVQQAYVAMEIEKRGERRPDYPF